MSPKPIMIRYKTASGAKKEAVIEQVIYMEVLDLSKDTVDKRVFMIDLNR